MSHEFHWGGINIKSLCKAVLPDIWMVFAVMVIAYLGLGIAGKMRYTPSYTSSTVVAVYPFNKIYTPEASSDALETVGALNEVFNSETFNTGLKDRLTEAADFSLSSQQISGTYILMLSVSSSTPESAYQVLRTALDYYREIAPHLVGDSHLEILSEPDFPLSAYNDSRILKRRPLLTLFAGCAMGGFLILLYVLRKTYKSASAIRRHYKNVEFFKMAAPASRKFSFRSKTKSAGKPNQEAVRKTALELLQKLRAKNGKSIFITSAAQGEGKTTVALSLAGELENHGKSVVILKPDMINTQDDFSDVTKDVYHLLEQAEEAADLVLIDGPVWTGSEDELIWKEAADTSLAICRQDKADFYAIERMITDLSGNDSGFLGCILYGF